MQQQIRARVGDRQEGLRAQVKRVLQAVEDNKLPRSGTNDRMETVAGELDRLAREELSQIEPRLTEARKENETGTKARSPEEKGKGPLAGARKHQEEAQRTFQDLLKLLEPWSSTREVKSLAKSILQDQQQLTAQTENLSKQVPAGAERADLKPQERAELDRGAELQNKLAERTSGLLEKMQRLARERESKDPQVAKQLKEAAQRGAENNVAGKMQQARESIEANQLARAGERQQQSAGAMEEVVRKLEDRREDELDRLVKKMKEGEKKLADLDERQEKLRQKMKDAAGLADAAQREQELRRLAREQEQLQKETQEMIRELSRLRADRAGQSLSQASARMQQAGRQMSQGEQANEQQEEALERLQDARAELQQARENTEEELLRERIAKLADQVKGLRSRQGALTAEGARIHREVLERKQWTRGLQGSLGSLADAQKSLGDETEQLAKDKLEAAKVLLHLLIKSADAMKQAAERMDSRMKQAEEHALKAAPGDEAGLDLPSEQTAGAEIESLQQAALRRIDLLAEALKPDQGGLPSLARRRQGANQGKQGGGGGGGGEGQKEGDNLPSVAELKALHSLQEELNERTHAFAKKYPDAARLAPKGQEELRAIRREQQEIKDLFDEVTAPPQQGETDNQSEKPKDKEKRK
jgi:hypothetical protein